ncbi:WD40-repeat-containing domain protein [Chytridium lagenaria]|nr:WD40-repeat-containing domain protein [Chytridium lagenaria]
MISVLNQQGPKDIEACWMLPVDECVSNPPTDGISDLSFCPTADLLAASSWDNNTRIWEVQQNGSTVGKAAITHEAPALCCSWSKDGSKLFSGGADKVGKMMDLQTGQTGVVASHDAPIKSAKFFDNQQGSILATASWDKTIKYWDLRTPNPIASVQLGERIYSMDVAGQLMVVGTADRNVLCFNLQNPSQPFKQIVSPLKWQTRTIACFPNASGFAIGSIEGRVGIQYIEEKDASLSFSFKCHRDDKNVHAVNAISFHPYGTFSTAGSDGVFYFWDKDSKQKLKQFNPVGQSISATSFSRTGAIFAYAASYDWGKGHEHYKQGTPNQIMLHSVKEEDVKPKPVKPKKGY